LEWSRFHDTGKIDTCMRACKASSGLNKIPKFRFSLIYHEMFPSPFVLPCEMQISNLHTTLIILGSRALQLGHHKDSGCRCIVLQSSAVKNPSHNVICGIFDLAHFFSGPFDVSLTKYNRLPTSHLPTDRPKLTASLLAVVLPVSSM
jgi:hypothetical protein